MIDAFATLISADDFALELGQLQRVRSLNTHLFNRLFSCASDYRLPDEEDAREKKLIILKKLGTGSRVALSALAHWITGLSTESLEEVFRLVLEQPVGPSGICVVLGERTAQLAATCQEEGVGVSPEIKIRAISVLPSISICRCSVFLLFHHTNPKQEPSAAVRCVALRALCGLMGQSHAADAAQLLGLPARASTHLDGSLLSPVEQHLRECSAPVTILALTLALDDRSDEVFDTALELFSHLFSLKGWRFLLCYLPETRMFPTFEKLGAQLRSGGPRSAKIITLLANSKHLHFQLTRKDRLQDWEQVIPRPINSSVLGDLQCGAEHLIESLISYIEDPAQDLDGAIQAVQALVTIVDRGCKVVLKRLRALLAHFTEQGRPSLPVGIGYPELKAFERAVDPAFYQQFKCKGGEKCTLQPEGTGSPPKSRYTYSYDNDGWKNRYVTADHYQKNCGVSPGVAHVSSAFVTGRCRASIGTHYPCTKGKISFPSLTGEAEYSISAFLKKFSGTPVISAQAKANLGALLRDAQAALWQKDCPAEDWAALEDIYQRALTPAQSYQAAYRKTTTAGPLEVEMAQFAEPDRRLIKAILDAMKVLSVGDVETQEFLIRFSGQNQSSFHWHEPTRIWIVETLKEITRGEVMKNGQTVFAWLGTVESRVGESPAVVATALKARRELRVKNIADPGYEMLLAPLPEQPVDAVGLPISS